jgi:sugar phosphate isomerase/epimerase
MKNRRDFLKKSGAVALSTLLASPLLQSQALAMPPKRPIGLQLYTLISVFDQDVNGNLKKIANLGFSEVESAFSMKGGYYGMKSKEFASLCKDLGIAWKSHHSIGAPFEARPDGGTMPKMTNLKDDASKIIEELAEGGVQYLVCAIMPFNTLDEWKAGLDVLQKTGEEAKKAGITFAFHNHDKEFVALDGVVPYDLMLSQISADVLKMELDLAWVSKAGIDPVAMFKKHPGRFPLWHVKDFDKEFKNLQPVGQGVIDFKRLFKNASSAGLQHFFVEHDNPADPFGSIEASIGHLRKNILK